MSKFLNAVDRENKHEAKKSLHEKFKDALRNVVDDARWNTIDSQYAKNIFDEVIHEVRNGN